MKIIGHGKLINRDPIFEMACLNKADNGLSDFPPSIFKIIIWNKEKEPPHIHIKAQGWDVSMLIDDEIILSVNYRQSKGWQLLDSLIKTDFQKIFS